METTIILINIALPILAISFVYIFIVVKAHINIKNLRCVIEDKFIQIGGKEYPIDQRYEKHMEVIKFMNRYISKKTKEFISRTGKDPTGDPIQIPLDIFFEMTFMFLKKGGAWPFVYPFRSATHIHNNVLKEEVTPIVDFVNETIYNTPNEDKKQGNEKLKQLA